MNVALPSSAQLSALRQRGRRVDGCAFDFIHTCIAGFRTPKRTPHRLQSGIDVSSSARIAGRRPATHAGQTDQSP